MTIEDNNNEADTETKDDADNQDTGGDGLSLLDEAGTETKAGERPEFLPETAWDAEKKTVKADVLLTEFEKAQKIAKDLRTKLGRGEQKPPAKAEDYKLPQFTEEADKPLAEILKADDPLVKGLMGVAHEAGMSQVQFESFMAKAARLVNDAAANNKGDDSEPTEEEKAEHRKTEMAKLGPNGPRIATAVKGFLEQHKGVFSEDDVKEIRAVASTAQGLRVLDKLRLLAGGENIAVGDGLHVDGLPSDAEIHQVIGSAAYRNGDVATHKKVSTWLEQRKQAGRPDRLQV